MFNQLINPFNSVIIHTVLSDDIIIASSYIAYGQHGVLMPWISYFRMCPVSNTVHCISKMFMCVYYL